MKAAWMDPKITELSILRGTKTVGRKGRANSMSSSNWDSSNNDESISASGGVSSESNDESSSDD